MDNGILETLIENYKLSKDEHIKILGILQKNIFKDKTPENNPSIMFVIGQPGCGKTTFIQNTNLSNYIVINSDNYRQFSKYSEEILAKYPTYYTKFTNFDAHLWGDELFSYGISNGYSVLREKAPVDYSLLELIKTLASKYDVVINVVVTGNLSSLLATRERYEKEILKNNNARLSNVDSHNSCYDLLPDFILKCLKYGAKVNYVVPINKAFEIISVDNDNINLLEKIREESNKQSCCNYKARMDNIKNSMLNRNAPQEQFEELSRIEEVYFNIMGSYSDNKFKK